jgi:hypothetical protein
MILSLEMDLERVGGAGNLLCFVDWRDVYVFLIDADGRFVRDVLNFRFEFEVPVLIRIWFHSSTEGEFEVQLGSGLLQGALSGERLEVVKRIVGSACSDWERELARIREYVVGSGRFDEALRYVFERMLGRSVGNGE